MPSEKLRKVVSKEAHQRASDMFVAKLEYRLKQKGAGTFASRHEVLGILTEEFQELIEAVKSNDMKAFEEELLDLMVGAFWGIASSQDGTLHW